jgi:hypothetical protein
LRDIIIPPYAISIPRIADLNKDLILGIGNNISKAIANTSNNNPESGYVGPSNPTDPRSPVTFSKSNMFVFFFWIMMFDPSYCTNLFLYLAP